MLKVLTLLLALTGITTGVVLLSSCEDETLTTCPTFNVGAIEGHILVNGQGHSVEVGARAQDGSRRGHIITQTVSDSTGWYHMELPPGLYKMELNPRNEISFSSDMSDTVRVTPDIHIFNMEFGSAEIRLSMPEVFNEKRFSFWLLDAEFNYSYFSEHVHEGMMKVTIPLLPQGSYKMFLVAPNVDGNLYLPGTTDIDEADLLVINGQNVTVYEADFSNDYASISGEVTGAWQQAGASRPNIMVYSAGNSRMGTVHCSEDGQFTCDFLLKEEVRLLVDYNGIKQWVGGNSFESARVFIPTAGSHITDISIVESGIEISLTGPDNIITHKPTFLLVDEQGQQYQTLYDYGNPYYVGNLSSGRYYLQIDGSCDHQSWLSHWYDHTSSLDEATAIDLGEGELRRLTIDLVAGGQIQGIVTSPTGETLGSVNCKIVNSKGEFLCDENDGYQRIAGGRFNFQGLADEEYFIAVNASPCGVVWYPGKVNFSEATPIPIINNGSVTDLNWSLYDCSKEGK